MTVKLPESVKEAIKLVVSKSKPKKIILFGSRARETHRTNSDFDIAVVDKTCSEAEWTKLLIELENEPITLYKIDLVEFNKLSPEYKKNILKEGKILHEAHHKPKKNTE